MTLLEDNPMRSEFAAALVTAIESDQTLLDAITVLEARNPGFIGRVIEDAEALAAFAVVDPDAPSRPTLAEASVLAALRTSSAKLALDSVAFLPAAAITDAMIDLIVAQARFHLVAANLERRRLARTPPPSTHPSDLAVSSRTAPR